MKAYLVQLAIASLIRRASERLKEARRLLALADTTRAAKRQQLHTKLRVGREREGGKERDELFEAHIFG